MKYSILKIVKAISSYQVQLSDVLPPDPQFAPNIRRAPSRGYTLNKKETKTALLNALRYIPKHLHADLIPEFLEELKNRGRIYGYRYRPTGEIKAKPIEEYNGILEARAIQLMIDNNLDFDVALYPYELVTYGESGQVCQNWMQYQLIKQYLETMTEVQTLVVSSGHPVGLFPTHRNAPRIISTNGLMIGMFDTLEDFHKAAALGVVNYGQMTAGGWMYIGPQGIVHGTYITLLNAGRKYLGLSDDEDLSGKLFITSGLGGMSGAQPKAADISGAISITAEVDKSRIETRKEQEWISLVSDNLDEIFNIVNEYRIKKSSISIAYHGNIVDLWQYVVDNNITVELASDQTSCHAVYEGGYTPYQISFEKGRELIKNDMDQFKMLVDESLQKQIELIKTMSNRGTFFWDYGNSFLKAVYDAGVKSVAKNVDDISEGTRRGQDRDNYTWIRDAKQNKLVVGSQARILYADSEGRVEIALKFNQMVRESEAGPIMMGRDHHDTGGTDSTFRETANIYDGSNTTSDMAHHSWAGNVARGMTMCVLSNGGGVGTGKAINGGFGLVLDGSERVDNIIKSALDWDVMSGVARRSWARNEPAIEVVKNWNEKNIGKGFVTVPEEVNDEVKEIINKLL
ncbi:MAG: urocanate hydratase [Candidatus Kariarchaeaceae archaeon]|jgi:urocanate hydratase